MHELDRELLDDQEPYIELRDKATAPLGEGSPQQEPAGGYG